jgi:hypothetical protein
MIGLEVDLGLDAQITGFNLIKRSRPSVGAVAMRIHERHFQLWIWDVPQTDGKFINLITRSVIGELATTIEMLPADEWNDFMLVIKDVAVTGLNVTTRKAF